MTTNASTMFVDYCLDFYGDGPKSLGYFTDAGLEPMTRTEAEAHARTVATDGNWGDGDSFDRERLRDLVLVARGEQPWGL